jgi:hypothetical protein
MTFKTKYGTKLTKKKQKNTWLTGSLKIKYYFKIFFKKKSDFNYALNLFGLFMKELILIYLFIEVLSFSIFYFMLCYFIVYIILNV